MFACTQKARGHGFCSLCCSEQEARLAVHSRIQALTFAGGKSGVGTPCAHAACCLQHTFLHAGDATRAQATLKTQEFLNGLAHSKLSRPPHVHL